MIDMEFCVASPMLLCLAAASMSRSALGAHIKCIVVEPQHALWPLLFPDEEEEEDEEDLVWMSVYGGLALLRLEASGHMVLKGAALENIR